MRIKETEDILQKRCSKGTTALLIITKTSEEKTVSQEYKAKKYLNSIKKVMSVLQVSKLIEKNAFNVLRIYEDSILNPITNTTNFTSI